jgi:phosphoribosylglycinamide formyltransferase 1
MEAILKSIDEGQIRNVRPKVVVSDSSDSPGLKLAVQKFGVSTYVLSKGKDKTLSFEDELVQVLDEFDVRPKTGVICLAGFMRILSPRLVERYMMRILNIHPSLLPAFPGLHAQRQALQYGVKVSGCTIHFVDKGVDTGPIIMQRAVSIFDSDTEESLSQRILKIEHKLYPEALRLFSEGNLKIDGRRISITDSKAKN